LISEFRKSIYIYHIINIKKNLIVRRKKEKEVLETLKPPFGKRDSFTK
jgi:hypothetical protein